MESCQSDAQGGINTFIEDQKKGEGDANFTLVEFDTEYDFVHKGTPIKDVGQYVLIPRGWTALLDAVGRAIVETGERLAAMDEADRPATVICVIVTDGEENSSKEFTNDQIKAKIEHQRNEYGWHFNFLGADDSAFAQASAMGIQHACAGVYNKSAPGAAHKLMSDKVTSARLCSARGQDVKMAYTDQDREKLARGQS
jgi:hypothetical protein